MHDEDDLALLEVRDLLFARLLQYRAFKHVAEMFAELEAAALRSYPRAVALEDQFSELLPEVMIGVDPLSFAQIAAAAFTPRPVPTVATEHLHVQTVSVPEQAERCSPCWSGAGPASGRRSPNWSPTARSRCRSSGGSWRCSSCIGAGR